VGASSSENQELEWWNKVSREVIGAAIEVHVALGPGLLERMYQGAMEIELGKRSISFERQVPIAVQYKGHQLGEQFLDLVVEEFLVLELKAVDAVSNVHLAQLVSYLRSGNYPLGLLLNFNTARRRDGLHRRINTKLPVPSTFLSSDL
jgi:GxxExxY protein